MINAIALDDEPLALEIINYFCSKTEIITLQKTFTSQIETLKYLENFPVDLLFLDINMPAKNGIDFYKMLKNNPMVIFTTAYSEYAVEGFNVNAIDYLLKPFSEDRFLKAVDKVNKRLNNENEQPIETHLNIRANYKLNRIAFEEILLIEGLDDYVQIHLVNNTKIVARFSMKGILEKLPEKLFLRVHRSFIIPIDKVKSIHSNTILLNDFVVPIGYTFKEIVTKHF